MSCNTGVAHGSLGLRRTILHDLLKPHSSIIDAAEHSWSVYIGANLLTGY